MIYVTHDQVEAMTMADKIVVLRAGKIEQVGAPLELYNKPANNFVAGFIGSPKMNFVEGTVAGARWARRGGQCRRHASWRCDRPLPGYGTDDKLTFGIRPEHIGIAEGSGVPFAELRVDLVEQLGDTTMLYASTKAASRSPSPSRGSGTSRSAPPFRPLSTRRATTSSTVMGGPWHDHERCLT